MALPRTVKALLRGAKRILKATGSDVAAHGIANSESVPAHDAFARDAGLLPFRRKTIGRPIGQSSGVVVYLCEPQAFEPARGSRTHVSLVVRSVDNRGPVSVEPGRRRRVERLEPEVARPHDVFVHELPFGTHVEQERSLGGQLLNSVPSDFWWHQQTLSDRASDLLYLLRGVFLRRDVTHGPNVLDFFDFSEHQLSELIERFVR